MYQGLSGLVTAALCWPAFLIIEGDWSSPVPIEMPVRLSAALSQFNEMPVRLSAALSQFNEMPVRLSAALSQFNEMPVRLSAALS